MPTTRATAEGALIAIGQPYLAVAGIVVTGPSPRASLSGPIAAGLYAVGISPVDPSNPSDADMTGVTTALWPKFIAFAEQALLQSAAAAVAVLPESLEWLGSHKQQFDRSALMTFLESRSREVRALYPVNNTPGAATSLMTGGFLWVGRRPGTGSEY